MPSNHVEKIKLPTKAVLTLKILLSLLILGALLTPFTSGGKLHSMLKEQWVDFALIPAWVVPIILLLSLVNYGLEAQKWQLSLARLSPVSWLTALQSVYKGCAMSQVFPWRTGDFMGKISVLPLHKKAQGIFLSAMNSFAQLLTTLIMGLLAVAFSRASWGLFPEHANRGQLLSLGIVGCCILVLFLFGLGNMSWRVLYRFSGTKLRRYLYQSRWLSYKATLKLIGLSALRYSTFLAPYVLLLLPFIEPEALGSLVVGLCMVFLMQSLLPGFILTDLPIRGFLHFSILGPVVGIIPPVGNAVFIIFVANQIIPSILGFYFMLKTPIHTPE